MDGREFLKLKSMYSFKAWCFPIRYFLGCFSKRVQLYVYIRAFFESLQFFFQVIYPPGLSVMSFMFPYFAQKLFCFLCIQFFVYPHAFSTDLFEEFSFVILECPALFVFLDSVLISFESPFFLPYLLIYFLSCIFRFVSSFILVFPSQNILMYFSFLSVYCCSFFYLS